MSTPEWGKKAHTHTTENKQNKERKPPSSMSARHQRPQHLAANHFNWS